MNWKLSILSFCCIVTTLCCVAQCATEVAVDTFNARNKDTTEAQESHIFNIKRMNKEQVKRGNKSIRKNIKHVELIPSIHPVHPEIEEMDTTSAVGKKTHAKKFKNSHGLNKKLLNKLGFTKVKAPNSHNRKRLAVESRRHASPDDSHMFIIKLPPSPHYYSIPKASKDIAQDGLSAAQNAIHAHTKNTEKSSTTISAVATNAVGASTGEINNGKKVSFPFSSNGRPGRIYHWNLPVIQKILDDKQRFANIPSAMKQQLIDIKDTPTWTKPWENETIEKSYGKANMMHNYKKSLKRKSPSYYAPANTVNKNSFNKYFAGNGKPKGFYVIKENQKKPLYYKNIVS